MARERRIRGVAESGGWGPMTPTLVDGILLVVLLLYVVSGWRRGLLATAVTGIGFVGGGLLALAFLPEFLAHVVDDEYARFRPVALVVLVLAAGAFGQALLWRLALPVLRRVRASPTRFVDAVLGAVLTGALVLGTAWFAAGLLGPSSPDSLGKAVGRSQVLAVVDRAMPTTSDRLLGRALVVLDRYGVPRVFEGVTADPVPPAEPAAPRSVRSAGIEEAGRSVLRVDALALGCGRSQEGTGWVVADDGLVVTNAHVVAGAERVTVTPPGEGRSVARVVAFDPSRDLAVLDVPDLDRPGLDLAGPLSRGDVAAVAGYPLSGPYEVGAARVSAVLSARGDDIYGTGGVVREVYALRADVNPGNSGGPLLTQDGDVAGVVFARSLDDGDTGYALTLDELTPVLQEARTGGTPVSTGRCAA